MFDGQVCYLSEAATKKHSITPTKCENSLGPRAKERKATQKAAVGRNNLSVGNINARVNISQPCHPPSGLGFVVLGQARPPQPKKRWFGQQYPGNTKLYSVAFVSPVLQTPVALGSRLTGWSGWRPLSSEQDSPPVGSYLAQYYGLRTLSYCNQCRRYHRGNSARDSPCGPRFRRNCTEKRGIWLRRQSSTARAIRHPQ